MFLLGNRFKLTVVREGFFDVIDTGELDALDPTDEQDAERIEALHKAHLIHHPACCGAARPASPTETRSAQTC